MAEKMKPKRGRPRLEITKNDKIEIRLEPDVKKQYFDFCEKNNINASEQLREFILKKIKK
jgi:hypothetical protein